MTRILLVGVGGFVGTLLRYWLSEVIARRYGDSFPIGTLIVNAVGCLLAGFLFYLLFERFLTSPTIRTVVFIGLLGGFTTFSAYGLQTFSLIHEGKMFFALLNVAISNIVGLSLVWVGYSVAKLI